MKRWFLSASNQSTDLQSKSVDCFYMMETLTSNELILETKFGNDQHPK